MPFKNFEGDKRWLIVSSTGTCAKQDVISIGGSPDQVTVTCNKTGHTYENGVYDETKNEITGKTGTYKLKRMKTQLVCEGHNGPWTANNTQYFFRPWKVIEADGVTEKKDHKILIEKNSVGSIDVKCQDPVEPHEPYTGTYEGQEGTGIIQGVGWKIVIAQPAPNGKGCIKYIPSLPPAGVAEGWTAEDGRDLAVEDASSW